MQILTVVGARPQFIKAAPVSAALHAAGHRQFLLHTGQHYDDNMSRIFFDELHLPAPDVNLGVGSDSHGRQTARMLVGIEEVIGRQRPDWVLVYGDTNSTLAGALAAVKLQVPVAHVEAGLRSFNRAMPEEHNRVLTDHCADRLFCPTQTTVEQLKNEGITRGVYLVGDTMYDAVLQFADVARRRSTILQTLALAPHQYLLATVHRPYNTDVPQNLGDILAALGELDAPVVFPVHPRTRSKIVQLTDVALPGNLRLIEPVGYLDMLMLLQHTRLLLTDSGGMQKEAFFFAVPCITLRPETEWVETVEAGWNVLTGAVRRRIVEAATDHRWPQTAPPTVFGDGRAGEAIALILQQTSPTAENHHDE